MTPERLAEIQTWANKKPTWDVQHVSFKDPKCWRCDKPTVTYSNVTMNMASSVESRFEPCCEDHAMMGPLDFESHGRAIARELLAELAAEPDAAEITAEPFEEAP